MDSDVEALVDDTPMTVIVSPIDGSIRVSCSHKKASDREADKLCYACAFHVNAAMQLLLGSRRVRRG